MRETEREVGRGRRGREEAGERGERIRARENFNLVWWEQIFVVHVRGQCFLKE